MVNAFGLVLREIKLVIIQMKKLNNAVLLGVLLGIFCWLLSGCDSGTSDRVIPVEDLDSFNFLEGQTLSLPIGAPVRTLMADINGDGNQDLVWNHVNAASNETVIGFSNGDGSFTLSAPFVHGAVPPDGWSQYTIETGDTNNDGRDDLVWNRVILSNTTYVSLSMGDGTFSEMDVFTMGPGAGWGVNYIFTVGDIDGQRGVDLIWNEVISGRNRTYISFSNGDGTYGVNNTQNTDIIYDHPSAAAFSGNESLVVEDYNGDGQDDLIWHTQGTDEHKAYLAGWSPLQNTIQFLDVFDRNSRGWSDYDVVVGNIDGSAGADLIWVASGRSTNPVHRDLSTVGDPPLVIGALQAPVAENEGPFELKLLDVNRDGREDLLMNFLGSFNRSFIGLGQSDGSFDFSRDPQDHPASEAWGPFTILVGDVNGDGREDVIYNNPNAGNDIYVGLSNDI